jgi:hypothetical protein
MSNFYGNATHLLAVHVEIQITVSNLKNPKDAPHQLQLSLIFVSGTAPCISPSGMGCNIYEVNFGIINTF